MSTRKRLVLGTRGSDLARTQTRLVEDALRASGADVELQVEIITTRGDETSGVAVEPVDRKAGRKGLFTSEIERALLAGEVDVAVHSAKDLPSEQARGLEIAAVLRRAAVDDVFINTHGTTWASLREGATIATGSVRREYQLKACRPDLRVVDIRGNVPTRLRKLAASDWDGIILARAGLERLGFNLSVGEFSFDGRQFTVEPLPRAHFLPAGGQGVIALQARSSDRTTVDLLCAVTDADTLLCLHAEREFLRLLNGDCDSPVGVFAQVNGATMALRAQVFEPPSTTPAIGDVEGPADPRQVAGLAAKLMDQINARKETNR